MGKQREEFMERAGRLYDELSAWRGEHTGASFDELVGAVRPKRRELMGGLLEMLALQGGNGAVAAGKRCDECGEELRYKGELKRGVLHGEGDSVIERAHYYCPGCQSGIFPPGRGTEVGEA